MLTLTETRQLPMYEFCYPKTKIAEFDRTSGTFKENEILTSTKNQNEGVIKIDIDAAAEALMNLAGQAPIVNFQTMLTEFDKNFSK